MPSLVGDVIMSAREACPDLPGQLPAPQSEIIFNHVAGANPLKVGTYYAVATYTTPWGETSPGPEGTIAVAPGQVISVNTSNSTLQGLASTVNVYIGLSAGGEVQQYSFPFPTGTSTLIIDSTVTFALCTPPQGNSAFLPDSGGSFASASQVFRWLNDGLNRFSALNGGLPDVGGMPSTYGQAQFVIPGDWQEITDAWYDGYPLFLGSKGLVYRHNTLTSLSGMMSQSQVSERVVVEIFAQPVRTAGLAALGAAITATGNLATTAAAPSSTGWVLPFGLLMFGDPTTPLYEIAGYTQQGNNFASMVRGLGGTNAQAWPVNTPINELNIMWGGMRAAQPYAPGQASNTLRLPSDWVPILHLYLLGRYRQAEQQMQEATSLFNEFEKAAKAATKKIPTAGDRQIQPQEQTAVDVYPLLSRTFGGGLIP